MRSPISIATALVLTAMTAACSGTPTPAETPAPLGTNPEAPLASASPSAAASAAPAPTTPFGGSATSAAQGPPPTAKVVGTTPSKESPMYLHVEVLFDNQATRACRIDGYVLTWPGGKKTISLESFSVPSHEQKKRSVKVHPDDGDLKTLEPDKASIALKTDCALP